MKQHGLNFSARDCYLNEGRTGQDVIHEAIRMTEGREADEEEIWAIYREKTEMFHRLGGAGPMRGVSEVLSFLKAQGVEIWIVTGSGQKTLFDDLETAFPGIFQQSKMITAYDVTKGKPDPEPYLKAWERSGYAKDECCVVENAPMGIQAGKGAGLKCLGVNTGILQREDLARAGADEVFDDMQQLLTYFQGMLLLPFYPR